MREIVAFTFGFLTSGIIFGTLACVYYVHALRRVRKMQQYMKTDAERIVHAAAKDIYGKKP